MYVEHFLLTGGVNTREIDPQTDDAFEARPVELRFAHNPKGRGLIVPDWDFVYWHMGRKTTVVGLAYVIMAQLFREGKRHTKDQILAFLHRLSFDVFVASFDEPEWLSEASRRVLIPVEPQPRKRGRPTGSRTRSKRQLRPIVQSSDSQPTP